MKWIARSCPSLEVLDICLTPLVTYAGVYAVLEGCRKLKFMGLFGCRHVLSYAVHIFKVKYPLVHVFMSPIEVNPCLASCSEPRRTKIHYEWPDTLPDANDILMALYV